jgi:hypothetical protein
MAFCASPSSAISTKPKPRDRPDILSLMMVTEFTCRTCEGFTDLVFGGTEGQVADVNIHLNPLSKLNMNPIL